jgi:hypothetical protein
MSNQVNIRLPEFLDEFAWDSQEIRDLVRTVPRRSDDDTFASAYDADRLCGLDAADWL